MKALALPAAVLALFLFGMAVLAAVRVDPNDQRQLWAVAAMLLLVIICAVASRVFVGGGPT